MAAAVFLACGTSAFAPGRPATNFVYFAILAATAVSLYYTPDYVHLSINESKSASWATKIIWRVVAAVLIVGLLDSNKLSWPIVIVAAAALTFANLIHRWLVSFRFAAAYWCAVLFIILGTLRIGHIVEDRLIIPGLVFGAAHFSIVIARRYAWLTATMTFVAGSAVLTHFYGDWIQLRLEAHLSSILALLAICLSTAILAQRAVRHTARSASAAIRELNAFTGYSEARIRELWATSNQTLASNWTAAHLDDADPETMKRWYAENSGLYMFAISGHNLEYKKIRSNLANLGYARGRCLDYGSGNGEIVLEEARRGCSAVYYDVPGETARFAAWRAQQQGLTLPVCHTKDDLLALVERDGAFDTITSFDVLEHLPDLPGELAFLASLLARGGRLLFDVPAGATRNHPMHLNHHLKVAEHMKDLGLADDRSLLQRLFASKERYIFRKPA